MIKGTYIFYENGKEIYRSPNIITKFGRRFLTNVIAGNVDGFKKDLAIGIGSNTATADDTRLQFEWYRLPVVFGSTDIQTINDVTAYSVVFKSTLPQNISGEIKEIGLYPSQRQSVNEFEDKFISDFSDYLAWYTESGYSPDPTYNTDLITYSKIGENVVNMPSTTDAGTEFFLSVGFDLSGYSPNDSISLSYYAYDENIANIRLRFYSSDTAYYELLVSPVAGTGHKITPTIPLAGLILNGVNSPDPKNIFKIGITSIPDTGMSTAIGMDGLRINDEDTFDPIFGIISRSVLSQAVRKYAGRQLDIEYKLDLGYGN